jgi:hypothetical protein
MIERMAAMGGPAFSSPMRSQLRRPSATSAQFLAGKVEDEPNGQDQLAHIAGRSGTLAPALPERPRARQRGER